MAVIMPPADERDSRDRVAQRNERAAEVKLSFLLDVFCLSPEEQRIKGDQAQLF